jgi:hypothetical protein
MKRDGVGTKLKKDCLNSLLVAGEMPRNLRTLPPSRPSVKTDKGELLITSGESSA